MIVVLQLLVFPVHPFHDPLLQAPSKRNSIGRASNGENGIIGCTNPFWQFVGIKEKSGAISLATFFQ